MNCPTCGEECAGYDKLVTHMLAVSPNDAYDCYFTCPFCRKALPSSPRQGVTAITWLLCHLDQCEPALDAKAEQALCGTKSRFHAPRYP